MLHIGASNFKAWQLGKALQLQAVNDWTRFASMQVQYNLIYREEEREMIPMCLDQGLGVLAWSALARGFLAGNRSRDRTGGTARAQSDKLAETLYFRDADFAVQKVLANVAGARGVPPMRIALAWIAARPGLTAPIIGATKLDQLDQAVAALDLVLEADEMAQLDDAYQPRMPFTFGR